MPNITCTWSITNMEHLVSDGGVIVVNWSCTAAGGGKSSFYGDTTKFDAPNPSSPDFIPYDQLTEEVVLGWVFAALGDEKDTIEADRIAKVEKQLHPVVESGLPWGGK